LTGQTWAQRTGGRFLVRIEDYDTARSRPEFVARALDDLSWLGLTWETQVLRQSEHIAVYQAATQRLHDIGLLFPCFATRTEVAAAARSGAIDPDGAPLYRGLQRHLSATEIAERKARGEPYCLRLDMARAIAMATDKLGRTALAFTELAPDGSARRVKATPERWGDAVLVRKDAPASYHLAVVVDDARQGVTHVTRGQDLFPSTDIHRLLQVLLDLPEPQYAHHALITDDRGEKLSKSKGATSLATLRAQGVTATDIRRRLGFHDSAN
jgi:glutamyl-Q tRNA(Asp) synthetase